MADNKVCTSDPAKAVGALADLIKSDDHETLRAGKRQLWEMVRRVGRPGNTEEQQAVVKALLALVSGNQPVVVKREAIWALSELGGDGSIHAIAALLAEKELRQDACMALERLPGEKSIQTLKAAFKAAPEDFKIVVAHSLRARGVAVDGPPCEKLKPTRQTQVKPVGRA